MKKIISFAIAILALTVSFAQEKGDRYLGLNFGTSKSTFDFSPDISEVRNEFIGLKYSKFISNKKRLSLILGLTKFDQEFSKSDLITAKIENNGFNIGIEYGILYELLDNFYAEATPFLEYGNSRGKQYTPSGNKYTSTRNNIYGAGLQGGLLWIPFKHFGISTTIASLKSNYSKNRTQNNVNSNKESSSSFTISNSGGLVNQTITMFYKF